MAFLEEEESRRIAWMVREAMAAYCKGRGMDAAAVTCINAGSQNGCLSCFLDKAHISYTYNSYIPRGIYRLATKNAYVLSRKEHQPAWALVWDTPILVTSTPEVNTFIGDLSTKTL